NPLFQVLFALQNAPAARWELPGVRVEPFGLLAPPTRFDLELHLFEQRDGGLSAVMTYPTQLFERESVLRMLAQYRRLLDGIAAEPDRAIRALPLLEPWEEKRLLVEWNATGRDYPREATLVTLFEAQARRTPDAPAVARGGESLTFRELEARAEALARALRTKGVGPEVRVGVCAERTLDLVVALLGTLKAGGAYVPLDPAYPPERVSLMLADARVGALLTQERLLPGLPPCEAPVVCLDRDWPQIAAAADAPGRAAAPDDLAYVIYTSGSTGKPKGVAIAHRSAAALLHWAQELFPAEDRRALLASTSVCFDLSVFELFLPLCFGGTVHLADNALAIASEPPGPLTLINTVPSAIAELLRQRAVPPSVRTVVLAGEPLSTRLVDELYALGHVARVFDCYGPSEDTTYSTWALREASAPPTIGRPIANTRAYVLDASLRPVPIGVRGELFLGGEGLARGYLGRPELTAERFVPDPFGPAPGGRLYRTGDVVRYRPDGQLEFFGRQDHQVKLRGFRIELGEIEAVLAGHPTVKDSVVVVREEASGAKRLVGYVTARDGQALDADALRARLQAKLPAYMVPTALVELGALPLSPNGKIDRRALPAPEAAEAAEAYEAPRTPAEQALARIWADVLRVPVVGATDNFFARGGDSILSLQVVARANQAGLRVTVKQLFQRQTVRELAAVAGQVEETDAEQGTVTGAVPLTPAQRWHLDRDPLDPHHFNQSALLELRRPIGAAAVEAAAGALDAHHDALRLRFRRTPDGWQQAAAELDGPRPFARVDLGALPESAQDAAVAQAAAEAQASLDLERGPVWRAVLFDLGPARPARLLLVVHHLAVDGVSWRILLEDLESACAQAAAGQPVRLPRKTTSFKRWAERLRDWAQAGGADHERAYWDGVAAGGAELPLDHPDGKNTVGAMRVVSTVFGEDQTRALLRDVPAANRTQPLEAMLAALGEALGSWTGAPEVRVDVEAHGREDLFPGVDLSRTVGWFTSIHPLRLRRGGEGIGAALAAVKEELRGVPRGGVGYGVLRYLRGHQALGPGSAVVFNYLGRFEALADPRGLFGFAAGSAGANRSERSARAHLLEVNAVIAGGRLRVDWLYAGDVHERATVERVAARFEHALGEVVEHCRRGAWSYTPSDFPLARVRAADLARITAGARDVEDVYPLGPMQEGMLFHTLSAPESGTYSVQARFELTGALDAGAFRQAWEQVAQRHPVLRTRFLWEGLDRPLQVVRRGVEIGWEVHDWSARPEAEQDRCFAELAAADRARGFALDRAPLMRLHLVRLAERRHRLVWSFHHALLDGWSVALVLGEALALARAQARGEKPALDAPVPYRDYVAWLPSQDMAAAERYWRQELSGFEEPTSLGLEPPAALPRSPEEAVGERVFTLPAEAGAALRAAGRRHGLTLSTLVQGAWAWLLSRYSGQRDVVFGVTVSGRPPSLPGVERMVGLFINTLPLRAAVAPGRETAAWLQELQDRQVEQRQHEASPLARVQRWSGVEGRSLFESVLVFENYPVAPALAAAADGLRVRSLGVREATNYPLTVVAAWSGDRLAL
ncbi:MAG TPA: amino acid adenylation domain-containing protein, partial [Vicinamibacteria bacterium]